MKPKIFISHITEERELAGVIRDALQRDFLGMVDVFVSSDSVSIEMGSKWLEQISTALEDAQIELVLCSPDAVKRPWINFEAGAGWVKGIPVVPVCHTGLRVVDLPIPLSMLQGMQATDTAGLERLYALIAKQLGSTVPAGDHAKLVAQVQAFENEYGLIRKVRSAVKALIELVPDLALIFSAEPAHRLASGDVPDVALDKMLPHLNVLRTHGMLSWATGSNKLVFGETGGGNVTELKIEVHDAYYQVAKQVMK
jgi:hypothetical protein